MFIITCKSYIREKVNRPSLIDLVEEKRVGGVIEKYYISRAKSFESEGGVYPELDPNYKSTSRRSMNAALQLKEEDKERLFEEVQELMEKWIVKTTAADYISEEEFVMDFTLVSRKEKTEEEK